MNLINSIPGPSAEPYQPSAPVERWGGKEHIDSLVAYVNESIPLGGKMSAIVREILYSELEESLESAERFERDLRSASMNADDLPLLMRMSLNDLLRHAEQNVREKRAKLEESL